MVTVPAFYRIRVKGQMGPEWSEWFGGLSITCNDQHETLLVGQVVDQSALFGILNTIRDLGLLLLEVSRETATEGKRRGLPMRLWMSGVRSVPPAPLVNVLSRPSRGVAPERKSEDALAAKAVR